MTTKEKECCEPEISYGSLGITVTFPDGYRETVRYDEARFIWAHPGDEPATPFDPDCASNENEPVAKLDEAG